MEVKTFPIKPLTNEMITDINQIFDTWNMPATPGAALAIVQDNKVTYAHGYGYANLEYDIPITPQTIFHVASVSKQFTDFAILLLAQEGKLTLDDEVHQFIPELHKFAKPITINHLIHHTSGLRDQWQLLMLAGWRLDDVITRHRIMKLVLRQKALNFEPGAEFLYSNTGYTLLAEIVERVSGTSLAQFCQERIFTPLKMDNTHFHEDHEQIVKNRAYSYATKSGGFKKSVLSYATVGATSLFTTVEDLAKWMVNFKQMQVGGADLIASMQKQFILNNGEEIEYACGLKIGSYRGVKTICHSGSDAGFRSHLVMFPEYDLGIVVLANLGSMNPERLTRQVADRLLFDAMSNEEQKGGIEAESKTMIDESQLIGDYLVGPGMMLTINQEDNTLYFNPTFGPKSPIVRQKDNQYVITATNKIITCGYLPSRELFWDLTNLFGRSIEAKKIELPSLTDHEYHAYQGIYYSEELDTHYDIVWKDHHLVIEHMAMPDCLLCPSGKDTFEAVTHALGRLKFTRDNRGDVNGFLVDRGRVQNVKFEVCKAYHVN